MIPQERVNKAAESANAYGYPRFKGERHEAFNEGFTAGVRFAESELQQNMIEYGNWMLSNHSPYDYMFHSNSETFDKFMQERYNQ